MNFSRSTAYQIFGKTDCFVCTWVFLEKRLSMNEIISQSRWWLIALTWLLKVKRWLLWLISWTVLQPHAPERGFHLANKGQKEAHVHVEIEENQLLSQIVLLNMFPILQKEFNSQAHIVCRKCITTPVSVPRLFKFMYWKCAVRSFTPVI